MKISKLTFIGIVALAVLTQCSQKPAERPNILFIAIDDLKPVLGCYGNGLVKTPNIDLLAKKGTVFTQNYCQQAVCGPTRASLMTGMRPDHTGVWDLKTRMRDVHPDILSLPQYLISQGYSTQGVGKIFDPRCVDKSLDEPSWSVPFHKPDESYYDLSLGKPALGRYQFSETKALVEKYTKEAIEKGLTESDVKDYVQNLIKPSVECADVPDNAYNDGAYAMKAKELLIEAQKDNKPFFLAVGFTKPHLPFAAPKKYWDLYDREQMPLASYQEKAENGPEIAYHSSGEIRKYTDIPPLLSFTDQDFGIGLPVEKQKELIHGYYAAVSYADAQVGLLLNTLDSLGLADNTIIVLWGDHGWHLGDHDLWCKHTTFEQATHTPLIIAAPGISSSRSGSPSEFIDIFPTLCDLVNVEIPGHLDGKSLEPVMKDPDLEVKEYSVSQYPRSSTVDDSKRSVMGYSIRTTQYRYVLWMKNNYRSYMAYDESLIYAKELYDYKTDPNETKNIADDIKHSSLSQMMHKKMLGFLQSQMDDTYIDTQK